MSWLIKRAGEWIVHQCLHLGSHNAYSILHRYRKIPQVCTSFVDHKSGDGRAPGRFMECGGFYRDDEGFIISETACNMDHKIINRKEILSGKVVYSCVLFFHCLQNTGSKILGKRWRPELIGHNIKCPVMIQRFLPKTSRLDLAIRGKYP